MAERHPRNVSIAKMAGGLHALKIGMQLITDIDDEELEALQLIFMQVSNGEDHAHVDFSSPGRRKKAV